MNTNTLNIETLKNNIELQLINTIDTYFKETSLYEGLKYVLNMGGKRLRPLILLITHYSINKNNNLPYKTATAIEIFHNFTLIHDDLMDNANLRRNKPTLHLKYNNNYAILVGDAMLTIVHDLIASDNNNKNKIPSINFFTRKSIIVCEGQSQELLNLNKNISLQHYLKIIQYKTAELITASLVIGYLSATQKIDNTIVNLLEKLGKNIGIYFQLQDDIMDLYPPTTSFGKKIGGDIIENKKTILWFSAYKEASEQDKKTLQQIFEIQDPQQKIKIAKQLFDKYNAKKLSENFAEKYWKNTQAILNLLNSYFDTSLLQNIFNKIKQRKK